jgi:teichuronic acid biosynthesis glycosyltransferase TuaC
MKVLIVCSGNWGFVKPFISEQVDSIKKAGVECDYFLIKGKGFRGYLSNYSRFRKKISNNHYDLVHAHYGLSGLFALLQRRLPVVITFHGVDLVDKKNMCSHKFRVSRFHVFLSKIAARLSSWNIFVNKNIIIFPQKKHSVISCGVNHNIFYPLDKTEARLKLGLIKDKKYILFSSSFKQSTLKNYELAQAAVSKIPDAELLEMKNFSREEVNLLMNACDVLLITSYFETGPLVVKEAMACNCPIISTDVGNVREVLSDTDGCCICSYDQQDIAKKMELTLACERPFNGLEKIIKYDNNIIAKEVIDVYEKVLKNSQ